jgi:hypothetical protein
VRTPSHIVIPGRGPLPVQSVRLEAVTETSLPIPVFLLESGGLRVTVPLESKTWRPLITPAEARRYDVLLRNQVRIKPTVRGNEAIKLLTAARSSLDPDVQMDAILRTRRARRTAGTQESMLVAQITGNLLKEVNIVLSAQEVDFKGFKYNPGRPPPAPEDVGDSVLHNARILDAIDKLAKASLKKSVQNSARAYAANMDQRNLLISQLV